MVQTKSTNSSRPTKNRHGLACTLALSAGLSISPQLSSQTLSAVASANALNPSGTDTTARVDPQGMSQSKDYARTPTGRRYPPPNQPANDSSLGENWRWDSSVEIGALFSDTEETAAEFHDYRDFSDGLLINAFNLSLRNPEQGIRYALSGGGVGRDDQYYRFSAARPGQFRVAGFYSTLPHEYGRNGQTIFQGAGSTRLTLPDPLVPGANNLAAIDAALASAWSPGLNIKREQGGLSLAYQPATGLDLHAGFTHQQRQGARPFGASLFPPFYAGGSAGGMIETIEPLDYSTNEFSLGFSYADLKLQWNVDYKNSFFSNHAGELSYENPFTNLPGTPFLIEEGRYDLYPDNEYHELSTDFAYRLGQRSQVFSTISWSSMRQNDALLPPTVNDGLTFTGIDLGQWNTTAALPTGNADARIDNLLLQAGLRLQPLDSLSINGTVRHLQQDNDTAYTALNPVTGEYGYITEDGASGDTVFGPGRAQEPIHYRSIPFAEDITTWRLLASYRLRWRSSLSAEVSRQERQPTWRERRHVDEDAVKLSLSSRALSWATLRLAFERKERKGDNYVADPYTPFYTSALPGFVPAFADGPGPRGLSELRKFDLDDRRQDKLTLKSNFLLSDTMDLIFSADYRDRDYGARYGLLAEDKASYSIEWNYLPSATTNAYVFFSQQFFTSSMATINDGQGSTDPAAGGLTYPLDAAWQQDTDGRNRFAGAGFSVTRGNIELESAWTYNHSIDGTFLNAASTRALATPQSGLLAFSLPDQAFSRHILESSVRWYPNTQLALRFYHRYESSRTEDWHYAGLKPLVGRNLFLNARPQNYRNHLFGVFVQYRPD